MRPWQFVGVLSWIPGVALAASIALPAGLTVPGTNPTGASFTYSGTLTQNDTIAFAQTGNPCLQNPTTGYCVNGAGVLVTPAIVGVTPVGGSSTFAGPSGAIPAGTWTYGALLMQISGVGTVQVFPANATNGFGSSSPPAGLTLPPTTLGALGFGTFSQTNPTITFIVADTFFGDNGGQFVLTQPQVPVPTLGEWTLAALVAGLGVLGAAAIRRRVA